MQILTNGIVECKYVRHLLYNQENQGETVRRTDGRYGVKTLRMIYLLGARG